ncbi:hypothetical protein L2E82_11689 [Cichorium intybus]|uniref:Uncharacterized protein n=1 Tax=Cichorium intybus TaxID=13427 RepID=A0ACB9GE12_CICIN|nr:hypothetical protein L2E82_11689 [Cichorium intybus]
MVHGQHNKISLSLLILFCSLNHDLCAHSSIPSENKNISINSNILIGMGIILDMESWLGMSIQRCITMAISDFYDLNPSYKTRIVIHTRDSKGDPVKALSAVDDLLKNMKVQAIIGPETHLQSMLLSLVADKAKVGVPHNGALLLHEVSNKIFKGVSGEFELSEGKVKSHGYEIINAIGYSEKRVGYWTLLDGIRRTHPMTNNAHVHLYSSLGNEAVIWPGGSTTAPKGCVLPATPHKTLKIGVLSGRYFEYFIDVDYDNKTNFTNATGFSMDVFTTCIQALPYHVPYILISYPNTSYDELVHKVHNGPLDVFLWVATIAFVLITVLVVWAIESMNQYSERSPDQGFGTIFWLILLTIFSAQSSVGSDYCFCFLWLLLPELEFNQDLKVGCIYVVGDKLSSNLSRSVILCWLLFVLVLFTSYTAKMTSLLTVAQIEFNSKVGIVGIHGNSFIKGITVNNADFKNSEKKEFYSFDQYADALSKDGNVSAIIDEIPYIKMFLGRYPGDYALVSSQPTTSGFAFKQKKRTPSEKRHREEEGTVKRSVCGAVLPGRN